MALDIHKSDDCHEWLYAIDDQLFDQLAEIFGCFYRESGIRIEHYQDRGLDVASQKILLKVIDRYIQQIDLNKNRDTTIGIISFRGFIQFTITKNWNLFLYCD